MFWWFYSHWLHRKVSELQFPSAPSEKNQSDDSSNSVKLYVYVLCRYAWKDGIHGYAYVCIVSRVEICSVFFHCLIWYYIFTFSDFQNKNFCSFWYLALQFLISLLFELEDLLFSFISHFVAYCTACYNRYSLFHLWAQSMFYPLIIVVFKNNIFLMHLTPLHYCFLLCCESKGLCIIQ